MAPLPKRKHSRARAKKRLLAHALAQTVLVLCPSCGKPIRSHMVCPFCGFYKGRSVVKHEDKT